MGLFNKKSKFNITVGYATSKGTRTKKLELLNVEKGKSIYRILLSQYEQIRVIVEEK